MRRFARTYGSANYPDNFITSWKYPTSPIMDNFGVFVPNANKTFGLEEFNFNDLLINEKIAYVPCYGTGRFYPRPAVEELRLVYKLNNNYFMHYATLFKVKALIDNDIPNFRKILKPYLNHIYYSKETQNYFGSDFQRFQNIINSMYGSNLISANNNSSSFLVNVSYDKIEILNKPISCKLNSNYAAQWYNNLEYPSN